MIFLNAYWLMKYKALPRIILNTIIMAVGYVVIAVGSYYNFFLALLGALIVGTASAFGDVTHLGYLGLFDPQFLGPFASGNGTSGLLGSLLYLLLKSFDVANWIVFMSLLILPVLYLANFWSLYRTAEKFNYFKGVESENEEEERDEEPNYKIEAKTVSIKSVPSPQQARCDYEPSNSHLNPKPLQTKWEAFLIDWQNFHWLFWLYFLEYTIITGFIDRISQQKEEIEGHRTYFEEHFFIICQFLYQSGVLIARSSLFFCMTKRTGLITFA